MENDEGNVKINVDIEELIQKLVDMKNDGFVTVEISVQDDDYEDARELKVSAVDIGSDDVVEYGRLCSSTESI